MNESAPNFGADFRQRLAGRLAAPLPGRAAHLRMAPELSYWRHHDRPPAGARAAGVLVLLFPVDGDWRVLLTLRPTHLTHHPGQISFPGGVAELGEDTRAAALRELHEELGVPAESVEVLGRLSDIYAFASNHHVVPWVGTATGRPRFEPNPQEVAEVLELPVAALLDPAGQGRHVLRQGELSFSAPHFLAGQHRVWGVTGMILAELADILTDVLGPE